MILSRLVASARGRSVCCALSAGVAMGAVGGLGVALAEKALRTVDQITDSSATAASGMFRFAPDLVRIAPGEAITFLNSRGSHTINTQKGLWPEGVPEIDISGQQRAAIVFDHPGLYGVTCRRHGKYGMVMLVRCRWTSNMT